MNYLVVRFGFLKRFSLWRNSFSNFLVHVNGQNPSAKKNEGLRNFSKLMVTIGKLFNKRLAFGNILINIVIKYLSL